MKYTFVALSLLFTISANADIEYSPQEPAKATPQEISKNRACFEELKVQGCGDPGDDINHFKSCLNNVHSTLTDNCKRMMTDMYGVK